MHRLLISAVTAFALAPLSAAAAENNYGSPPVPPITEDAHLNLYCVYGNLLYSIGSPICVGKASYECTAATSRNDPNDRPTWKKSTTNADDCLARQ
jgi:hypothetical protein